ncbi:MAG: beta-glucanase, partial [Prevotella sp.]|nr:beta-glucanase [Prevotella sp.]
MKRILFSLFLLTTSFVSCWAQNGWKLIWSDEFNTNGPYDSNVWEPERGFARNHEAQWYQQENAYCQD